MTQDQMVLEALQRGDQLTSLDAMQRFGITRLASVVHRLRREHEIDGPLVEVPNRYGKSCYVSRYRYIRKLRPMLLDSQGNRSIFDDVDE